MTQRTDSSERTERAETPGQAPAESRAPAGRKWHWQAAVALVVGLAITAALTISSQASYHKNELRLTGLQTRLTALVLQTAQPQLEETIGRIAGLTAEAPNPAATFQTEMKPLLSPKGQYASGALAVVNGSQVRVLGHVGTASIRGLSSPETTALFLQSARSQMLVTSRVVGSGVQKLGYMVSARGAGGVFVVGVAQQLPVNDRVTVQRGNPDSNLNFALYFGKTTSQAALIETNVSHLPLTGTVARATIPWGNNSLTFVASPRTTLVGTSSEYLPWGLLAAGILLSFFVAGMTDRLVRRRHKAEALAARNEELYDQQRTSSLALQRALLPKQLPPQAGFGLAARYVPGTQGAAIGGDWYSVVAVDEHRFAVVIGDVSGHSIAAAGIMAAPRYMIRTFARLGFPPDEVLRRTGQEVDFGVDEFATALVGVVDTRSQQIALASAGHPPPLLISEGDARFLDVTPGVPLGVLGRQPAVTTVPFQPGSTLVLFTDGLIEQRGHSLDDGLTRILAVAGDGKEADLDQLITDLLSTLTAENQDDIAVLVVRFYGQEPQVESPSTPDYGQALDEYRTAQPSQTAPG